MTGAFSSGLVWFLGALYYAQNASLLLPKIDRLIGAQYGGLQFIAISLIAVVCGGIACACGYFLRNALSDKTEALTAESSD